MPQFLEYPVKNRDDFEKIKSLYKPDYSLRLYNNWIGITENYRKNGYKIWLYNDLWGFFGVLRQLMGVELLSVMFYDDPIFIHKILSFYTDYTVNFWGYILNRLKVDIVMIWEDMAYKNGSLISPKMFKEFLLPYYKKLTRFLKDWNVDKIFVDSDGNVNELIPLWIEAGIDGIYPMEVMAGMNIVKIRKSFPELIIAGGIDKHALAKDQNEIDKELEKADYVLRTGRYIPFVDHSIPSNVSWENFRYYREKLNNIIDKSLKT